MTVSVFSARSKWPSGSNQFMPHAMRYFSIAVSALLLLGCNTEKVQTDAETADFLSLYKCPTASGSYAPTDVQALVSDSARWNGKAVRISGYFVESSERSAIYPSLEGPSSLAFPAGVWALIRLNRGPASGQRATFRGIYTSDIRGHLGQWPGTLCVHSITADNTT